MKIEEICPICKGEKKKNRKYCSRSCSNRARTLNCEKLKCGWCKKEFHRRMSHKNRTLNHFCSKKCEMNYKRKDRIEKQCPICSKNFVVTPSRKNQKFCSQKCMGVNVSERNKNSQPQYRSYNECSLVVLLRKNHPKLKIVTNDRKVLNGFEIDIWIPSLKIGIEYNGPHHFYPIYGNDVFDRTKINDFTKRKIAKEKGITIVDIDQPKNVRSLNKVKQIYKELSECIGLYVKTLDITQQEILTEQSRK